VSASHPSAERLLEFVHGRLDEAASAEIETHLQDCAACIQILADSPQSDALLQLARAAVAGEKAADGFLPTGTRIGEYEILEVLGRGGMGSVYRAYDPHLRRDVALKLIPAGCGEEYRRRLRLEAETIASLQHPGIVRIYQIGECPHGLYLALELLYPGGLAVFGKDRRHSPQWAAGLARQLAESIEYAHRAGIIHRDLKPDNILLAPSASHDQPWDSLQQPADSVVPPVKITDFGLAKCLDEDSHLTRAGIMLGTPEYMAPEQLPDSGETVGPAADIYALGVILYQLLSGRLPFASKSLSQILRMLRDDDPPALRSLNPAVPKDLDTICQACLMKTPAARYPTAQALADDLGRFLHGEPLAARPLNWQQRLFRWARRKPLLATHYLGALFLYNLHLFAMWVLQEPRHVGFFHAYLSTLMVFWLIAVNFAQKLCENPHRRRAGEYAYALLTSLLCLLALAGDAGPASAPVHIYLFLIVIAALMRPHPHLIWFQTVLSIISYLALTAVTWYWQPRYLVSWEEALVFIFSLPLMGGFLHLLLRRARA
jgi:serine/threonine protein kinase